ncbi:hypothetical protein AB9G23_09465 [Francisella philomiragia]|uniref:hypothetical protein n=1 Tax=Francisella philomiragia TaxID=28110 RepID=UPI003517D47E
MGVLKLLSIIASTLGLGVIAMLLIKYIRKNKKIKSYTEGIKNVIKKTTKENFDSSSSDMEIYYKDLTSTLINRYYKYHKQACIILFSGNKVDMLKDFELNEESLHTVSDYLFIIVDSDFIRFIICLDQDLDKDIIIKSISVLDKMITKLYDKKVILLPTLQIALTEQNNLSKKISEHYYFYLKKLERFKLFRNIPYQIRNLNGKKFANLSDKTNMFKTDIYIQLPPINLKDNLGSVYLKLLSDYVNMSFRDDLDFSLIVNQFFIVSQAIDKHLKQIDNLSYLLSALPSKQPCYLNLIDSNEIYTHNTSPGILYWRYKLLNSLFIVSGIGLSLVMIDNNFIIHSKNKSVISLDNKKIEKLSDLEEFYKKTNQEFDNSLWIPAIYPEYGLYTNLDKTTFQQAWNIIAIKASSSSYTLKRIILSLLLASVEQPKVKKYISTNIQAWSDILNISPSFLEQIINHVPRDIDLIKHISFNIEEFKENLEMINYSGNNLGFVQNLIKQNKTTINIEQLQGIIKSQYQTYLMLIQLKNIIPLISITDLKLKKWININDLKHIFKIVNSLVLNIDINSTNDLSSILTFSKKINTNTNINSIKGLLDSLKDLNNDISNNKDSIIKKYSSILIQAYLNSYIGQVLEKKDINLNILPSITYAQKIAIPTFKRSSFSIPIAYTKASIIEYLQPINENYLELLETYKSLGIDSSFLQKIYDYNFKIYENNYINIYKKLFKSALPLNIEDADITMLLMDLSSNQSPFYNTLLFIHNNTINTEQKSIRDAFSSFNKFIISDQFFNYQKQFEGISEVLMNKEFNNYYKLLTELNSTDKKNPTVIINALLDKKDLPAWVKEGFLVHIDTIKNYLYDQISEMTYQKWRKDVSSNYQNLVSHFPFNLDSDNAISTEQIKDAISIEGDLYKKMRMLLEPYIIRKSIYQWEFVKDLPNNTKNVLSKLLNDLNRIQTWQASLWNKQLKPIAINFKINGMDIKTHSNESPIIASFIGSSDKKVIALNTNDNGITDLNYNWFDSPTVSVGIVNQDQHIYQKTFTGNWAFFKLLKAAKRQQNKYSLDIVRNTSESAVIEFEIFNTILGWE